MSYILIQHNLTDEDKEIILNGLRNDFPISVMIGTKDEIIVRCKDCKYRLYAGGVEKSTRKEYYCGYEYDRCDPYEMTRNANDPNYFCGDAIRKED